MACQKAHFENQILELYNKISNLKSLKPSKNVDTLFQQLMTTCLPTETNIDVKKLCPKVQDIRTNLIKLRSEAIGYSEQHFSTVLGSLKDNPLTHLDLYPYYTNYLKLSKVEFDLLMLHTSHVPTKIAFVGSGSLPFTSIILAKFHLPNTTFHNFDIDPQANSLASQLVSRDPDLSCRIIFHTMDILNATEILRDYEVVFLASLVGVDKEAKVKVIEHLEKHMAPGALTEILSASVKSLQEVRSKEGGSSILLCLSCRQKLDQEAEGGCTDEKHLKNICAEQATKIEQLTCLLDQYKNNTMQEPSTLMHTNDGGDKTNQLSEKEALLKEIAELKSKLQPTKSTENLRSSLLLRSFQMRKSTDLTRNTENNSDGLEEERERWTEMESEWISLTDDLRLDIDNHRRHAEDLEIELRKEKTASEELNDALGRAMLGHSRFIEQYTELQENYDELVERHNVTLAGIVDVKKAAAKAAVKGRHGKSFAKAFSAELTAIRAEKEREREFLKKENKGLKIQLRDTAEAVQAAGELLIRLREAEQYVQSSEERFSLLEEENAKLKMQMEKLKSKHKTEMSTMKQYLAESKLPGSALQPWFTGNEEHLSEDRNGLVKESEEHESEHRTGVVSYDDYADDQAWRAEFGAIYQDHQY